jgi:hypothetical protein
VLWSLAYLVVCRLFELVVLLCRSPRSKELEILVLRHELSILRRQVQRPQLREADRRRWLWRWLRPTPLTRSPGRGFLHPSPDLIVEARDRDRVVASAVTSSGATDDAGDQVFTS